MRYSILLTLLLIIPVFAQDNPLVGIWGGVDSQGERITLIINNDFTAEIVTGSDTLSNSFHDLAKLAWRNNTKVFPLELDLIIIIPQKGESTLKFIYCFVSCDEIILKFPADTSNPGGPLQRASMFTSKENAVEGVEVKLLRQE